MHGNHTMMARKALGSLKNVDKFGFFKMHMTKLRYLIQRYRYQLKIAIYLLGKNARLSSSIFFSYTTLILHLLV